METFKTEVHVPPGSHINFELHYQEMMQRKLGVYEHSLHLQPGRLVPQLQVEELIKAMSSCSDSVSQKICWLILKVPWHAILWMLIYIL